MLRMVINRRITSYRFKADEKKADSFDNNWLHNSEDDLSLIEGNEVVFTCKCQSVANYCFGEQRPGDTVSYGDTVAPGEFTLKCFAPPRAFHGEIHAITRTRDIDGQWIDRDAMQTTAGGFQNGRWLVHDRFSFKTGRDTRYAWSAGCFILSSEDLRGLNKILRSRGVKAGDEVSGVVIEF